MRFIVNFQVEMLCTQMDVKVWSLGKRSRLETKILGIVSIQKLFKSMRLDDIT